MCSVNVLVDTNEQHKCRGSSVCCICRLMCKSQRNLRELVPSFYYVGSRNGTQVIKHPRLQKHLTHVLL